MKRQSVNRKSSVLKFIVFFSLVGLCIAGSVYSHSGATGIVKERMDAMKDMGDRSKTVADMFKGKTAFEQAAISEAADVFVMHGSRMLDLFPDSKESRSGSKTEALLKIWDEWDDFSEMIVTFNSRSEALQNSAASSADMGELKKAFFKTTKSCSGCHKRFRKPKD